jgi:pyruvate dehydrogenase E1 component alpha subunit
MDVGVHRRGELKDWMEHCPLARVRQQLLDGGTCEEELAALDKSVRGAVAEAEAFARASPLPDPAEVLDHVFCMNGEAC